MATLNYWIADPHYQYGPSDTRPIRKQTRKALMQVLEDEYADDYDIKKAFDIDKKTISYKDAFDLMLEVKSGTFV